MGLFLSGKKIAQPYLNGRKLNAYLNNKKIWDSEDWGTITYVNSETDTTLRTYKLQGKEDWDALSNSDGQGLHNCVFKGLTIGIGFIIKVKIGKKPTYTPEKFLSLAVNCIGLEGLEESNITEIRDNFMINCVQFNQALTMPAGLRSIGENFLFGLPASDSRGATVLNKPIVLNEGLQTIGGGFLCLQTKFNQPVSVPSTVTSIGGSFLSQCSSFNQPITFNQTKEWTLGNQFLVSCSSYNQPIDFGNYITSIGKESCVYCTSFNKTINFGTRLKTLGDSFLLGSTSFNQPITIPASVTAIGDNEFYECSKFNSKLTFNQTSNWTLGSGFLANCVAYNQAINFGNYLTSIGDYFLYETTGFNNTLNFGTRLKTIGDCFMIGSAIFNKAITFPSSLTTIGAEFLANCYKFNSSITWPGLKSLGGQALFNCSAFQANITLPTGMVFSNGVEFIVKQAGGLPYAGTLNVNNVAPASSEDFSLSSISPTAFSTSSLGTCTITGSNASAWKSVYPTYINAQVTAGESTLYLARKHN